jgi:hypothetical protein
MPTRTLTLLLAVFISECVGLPSHHQRGVPAPTTETLHKSSSTGTNHRLCAIQHQGQRHRGTTRRGAEVDLDARPDIQSKVVLSLRGGSSHGFRSALPDPVSAWLEDNLYNESRKEIGYTCLGIGATLFVLVCIPLPIIGIFMNRLGETACIIC